MKKKTFLSVLLVSLLAAANAQWQATAELPANVAIISMTASSDLLFAGTDGGGVFSSSNNGISWTAVNNGFTNLFVTALAINGTHIFAGTKGGVYLSLDNGSSWSKLNYGLADTVITSLAISGSRIFAGTSHSGVYLSLDNGNSWAAVNTGLSNPFTFSLGISGINVFVTTFGGVFLSTDNGSGWSAVNTGLPYAQNQIGPLAACGNTIFTGAFGSGVYVSANNGSSWTKANNGLTDSTISAIAVSGSHIFAGTNGGGGMFHSSDNGNSWKSLNTGLPSTYDYCFAFDNAYAYVGTDYGVFKLALADVTGIEESFNGYISVYPVPATDKITVELPGQSPMQKSTATISTIQGATVIQQPLLDFRTTLDISGLAKGVYIVRISNDDKAYTIRVVKE